VLTVAELLRDLDLRLLAGEAGLDVPVRWVHISELEDPTPWMSGGELLLTTGLQLDTPARQQAFVDRLADHQLSGLGFGTGFAHATVPDALVAAARARSLPLVEVPYEVPFIAVTEAAFSRLVNEQYAVLRRAIAAHERLERIVLAERGLDAVGAALATLIGGSVLIFDARGGLLVRRTFRQELDERVVAELGHELAERARSGDRQSFAPATASLAGRALVLPVRASGAREPGETEGGHPLQAWLLAVKDDGGFSELDRLTLHQAVTIVALELLRRRIAEDTERRLAGDVLAEIVSGELTGPELTRRLAPFGLSERVGAIVLAAPRPGGAAVGDAEAALAGALRAEATQGLVARSEGLAGALVPGLDEDELFPLAERIGARVARALAAPVRLGVGRAVSGEKARRAFHEARCALEALALAGLGAGSGNGDGAAPPAAATIATYRDLGSFQLLLSLQDDDALRLFCDSVLAPIEQSEGAYGGELMRSLEAFIEENGQWERAARRLYCHRHTLRYRMRRVEELTGRSLGSARDRIEFWLALRGRDLVR
jgi:purine catabolism regulator